MAEHVDKKARIGEELCINTIRMLSADQPSAGKSGHPGAPMGCAPMAHVLFSKVMKFNPKNPKWSNRDRFVLSNGHGCALQYSMLHLAGFDVSLDDLKSFRSFGSKCPGHPENFCTPGVEVSTGPLGQGISNAVGLALAEKHLAAEFNRDGFNVVDHYTYVICGDGCLQEGVSSEASSLAGHLGLGKLIVLYDDNKITIDGHTDLSFTEDVAKRYEAYGWQVITVDDGNHDHEAINKAVAEAKKVTDKPTLIKIRTIIGYGSKAENTHGVHGAPLKPDDLSATKEKFGLPGDKTFFVPDEVKKFYDRTIEGAAHESKWNELFAAYKAAHPELAGDYERRFAGKLPADWKKNLPSFSPSDPAKATRQFSEIALNAVASALPEIVGGSADLTPSNLTKLTMSGDFQKNTPIGRYIRFGVREHGMAAICNGIFAHGGLRPFCATFYNFIGYALGAVRVSALSQFGVIYIATHDSIFLGEDGPTHQPIEMNASLRAMPNMYVYRPADGNETVGAYVCAVENSTKTSVLALSRQGVPNLAGSSVDAVAKGAYIVQRFNKGEYTAEPLDKPDLVLVASGSEVSLAIEAAKLLKNHKVRIVSVPCRDLFVEQSDEYKKAVLGEGIPIMSVEASATYGWGELSHVQFGLDRFGASATIAQLQDQFGFNAATVADEASKVIAHYAGPFVMAMFRKNQPVRRLLWVMCDSILTYMTLRIIQDILRATVTKTPDLYDAKWVVGAQSQIQVLLLSSIPPGLVKMYVASLSLAGNNLTVLPEFMFFNKPIQAVNVAQNPIASLPGGKEFRSRRRQLRRSASPSSSSSDNQAECSPSSAIRDRPRDGPGRDQRKHAERKFRQRYMLLQQAYEQRLQALAAQLRHVVSELQGDTTIHYLEQDPLTVEYAHARIAEIIQECFSGERERYVKVISDQLAWQGDDLREAEVLLRAAQRKEGVLQQNWKRTRRELEVVQSQLASRVQDVRDRQIVIEQQQATIQAISEERDQLRLEVETARLGETSLAVLRREHEDLQVRYQNEQEEARDALVR
ncbi:hypothetical protein P43SY_011975 [Pythium insidiosum]|uniref:transketolase n=1 Tax=Pythium insidiosum TaxID=114742 RepID=A0AAD5L8B8_PYTIN|nr:hypothetical protein P43SY_011975 [Pythium insidiosum]